MPLIKHVNIADAESRVYCCLRNRVVQLEDNHREVYCAGCSMFAGDARGLGVECEWEDVRAVADPHVARDPEAEWISNQARKITTGMRPPEAECEEGLTA